MDTLPSLWGSYMVRDLPGGGLRTDGPSHSPRCLGGFLLGQMDLVRGGPTAFSPEDPLFLASLLCSQLPQPTEA